MRVKPNVITTIRLATGLLAAGAFALGGYGWMAIGALIFLVSLLLDRADGELARQTDQMSLTGHRFDLISDFICSSAAFLGLGVGVSATVGPLGLWLGALAALGIGALFFELNVLKAASVGGHRLFGGEVTLDEDDAMLLVPVLIWGGLAWPMVIAAAVITPLASLCVAGLCLRQRNA
jgi:phosphatidylglycerophosphate synthase